MFAWEELRFSESTPLKYLIDRLPDKPALYAFCSNLTIEKLELVGWDDFRHMVDRAHGIKRESQIGFYESVTVLFSNNRSGSYFNEASFNSIKQDKVLSFRLTSLLKMAENLISPYYLGETTNLQLRVKQHLDASSALSKRLGSVGLTYNDMFLKFVTYESLGIKFDIKEEQNEDDDLEMLNLFSSQKVSGADSETKKSMLFFEEVLTRICKPRFIEKIGENKD